MNSLITKYFPDLTDKQLAQFEKLSVTFPEWNAKVNMVSRKDIEMLEERHILHSLAISKHFSFGKGVNVIDVGTGGGFPGIPLAIMNPEAKFDLVDRIGKKINVVNTIAEELGLKNVKGIQSKAQLLPSKYDFVVSRAVTAFPDFMNIVRDLFRKNPKIKEKGIIYLKGGDFNAEIAGMQKVRLYDVSDIFEEEFFETKRIIFLPKK